MGWRRRLAKSPSRLARPARAREQPPQVERGAVTRAASQLRFVFRDRTRRVAARLEHEGEIIVGALDVSALGERSPERPVRIVPSFQLDVALAQLDEERRTVDFVRQRPGERGFGHVKSPRRIARSASWNCARPSRGSSATACSNPARASSARPASCTRAPD